MIRPGMLGGQTMPDVSHLAADIAHRTVGIPRIAMREAEALDPLRMDTDQEMQRHARPDAKEKDPVTNVTAGFVT
jgi:hypothetical protein